MKVAVIGGGIAGLQAGIFTAKARIETTVFDTEESLVKNTSNIQNLIGHDSVSGQELLRNGKNKLEEFDANFKEEEIKEIKRTEDGFEITTEEEKYHAEYLILACAGQHESFEELEDIEFEDGEEGPYMMEKHVVTDERNQAAERIYAAGLTNSWEYQTSVCIGDGAKAAINLISEIEGEAYVDHDT